ncbi:MAG: tetratricopeptide repeat protein [Deltaproteobacteria bacterium]|nr:tetratricopeptide repeat protein [Deltaproteobacteria bacterium]
MSHEADIRDGDRTSGVQAIGMLSVGTLLGGRYEVVAPLGSGGYGSVYRGRHVALDLPVAIKTIHLEGVSRQEVLARFVREARTVARVKHRHVLTVFDAGLFDDGTPYLVTELIEGVDLERRLMIGALPVTAVVQIGRQLVSALVALEDTGIVHRDIKPGNLMLRREADGGVHLTVIDFGIAKSREPMARLTRSGAIVGTPHYMSPEQLRGEGLDARADLWAACAVLYECLCGQPPFDGDSPPVVIGRILTAELTPVLSLRPDCPPELAAFIERGLSRSWETRFEDARSALGALDAIVAATGPHAWDDDVLLGVHAHPILPVMSAHPSASRTRTGLPTPAESLPNATSPIPLVLRHAVRDADLAQGLDDPQRLLGLATGGSLRRDRRWAWAAACAVTLVIGVASAMWTTEPRAEADARPALTNVGATASKAPHAVTETSSDHMARGLEAMTRGELESALGHYRTAVELSPDRADAHRALGLAASRSGRTGEALRAFERYLSLAPDAADTPQIRERIRALREQTARE